MGVCEAPGTGSLPVRHPSPRGGTVYTVVREATDLGHAGANPVEDTKINLAVWRNW